MAGPLARALNVYEHGRRTRLATRTPRGRRNRQYVRLPDGTQAVEALASGIPTVLDALRTAEMPPPVFDDDGLRFTVVLRQKSTTQGPAVKPGSSSAKVLAALNAGPLDIDQLALATGLAPANIRKRLRELRGLELVIQHEGPGFPTTYERTR